MTEGMEHTKGGPGASMDVEQAEISRAANVTSRGGAARSQEAEADALAARRCMFWGLKNASRAIISSLAR